MIRELAFDQYEPVVRLRALERLETARRSQAVVSHDMIAALAKEDARHIGGPVHKVVADLRFGSAALKLAAGCATPSSCPRG